MDLIRKLLKWTLFPGLMVLLRALETVYGPVWRLWDAAPDFLTAYLVCAACLEGPHPGALLGILAGVLRGSAADAGILLTPLYYAAGYLAGRLTRHRLRSCLPTALLLSLPPAMLAALAERLTPLFRGGAVRLTPALLGGTVLHGCLAAVVLWPLCRAVHSLGSPSREERL